MDAAGFDLVLVETVGTGQSEVDVARLADSLLVAFPPAWATRCRRSRPASWNWPTCWW
jgi:putative protein kinase ArgK-like GTPase of G3E family